MLSISACALRSCLVNNNDMISFEKIHELNKKCTPIQIMSYQAALLLHKTINFEVPDLESITVLNQMTVTCRQTLFLIFRNNSTRIGMNTTANKFYQLTGKISLNSLGLTFTHFKKLMKVQFLKYGKTWPYPIVLTILLGTVTLNNGHISHTTLKNHYLACRCLYR